MKAGEVKAVSKKTIEDLGDLKGKKVLIRVDFNVPLDAAGNVTNDRRIRAALPTIRAVLDAGGAVILMSHLGRPRGDPRKDAIFRMNKVGERLASLLGKPVKKMDQVVGPEVEAAAKALQPGEVMLLENVRFHPGEQKKDPELARQLAALGDIYVNDAFGTCHREDVSMAATPRLMAEQGKPRVVGQLVAKELDILDRLLSSPPRPVLSILGGAKVSDKIGFIKALLQRVDKILIGGAMAYTFLKSRGKGTGNSRVELDKLDVARELLELGKDKIVLPVDFVVVDKIDAPETARVAEGEVPGTCEGIDIGPKTSDLYKQEIAKAATVVWNGPVGKFEDEPYSHGTRAIAEALANAKAITIVGGGETAEAVEEFGYADRITHVSTGGGAFLEYVEGTPFVALQQIEDRK
jgi:phosphoglycerate kinase